MPIHCPITFRPVPDPEFAAVDKRVMASCFASQNELGRLCEERVYENDVAARLRADGFTDLRTQVPIHVSLRSFKKTYRLDFVMDGNVYEFKAADSFVPTNETQVIHYAALLGLDRIKLVNFGPSSVEGRMKRCPFAEMSRQRVTVDRVRWRPLRKQCEILAADAEDCLRNWGGFLEAQLYQEALIHFNGGEDACVRRLPVARAGFALGHHAVALHAPDIGFVTTAFEQTAAYEGELKRLLCLLPHVPGSGSTSATSI